MTHRHKWQNTESQGPNGAAIQRCANCETERMPDASTKSLYGYRRGRAIGPMGRKMPETWAYFISGVTPKCAGPKVLP